ncbi:Disks large-associated protein 5 [Habropoda laboriosa]|uniref:Disks large-associated protein 5 n=1 Tax=Habropoda laboriosa TaxID=597456 RepID=A0A0L7QWG3_9HYME|nr:Disks large-associated protein 5 [Habropoda laboriosa]
MSTFRQQYKEKTFGFGNANEGRFLRTKKHEGKRKTQRAVTFNENRMISNSTESTPQNKGMQLVPAVENRLTRFLKWKVERERRRKFEQANKKPPFVVGVVHHKFCSPVSKDDSVAPTMVRKKTRNQIAPMALATPEKRITRATEKRLLNKLLTQKVTEGAVKNISVMINKEKYQREDAKSFAPVDHNFKAPVGLCQVPLFGRVAIENTPIKTKFTFSPLSTSKENRKSGTTEFNVEPVNIQENDAPNDKESDSNDAEDNSSIEAVSLKLSYDEEEIFNSSNNNNNKNEEIKSGVENVVRNSEEYTNVRHNNDEHLKEQLTHSFSLCHSPSDDIPAKDTVMKNLNISVEEEEHTAQYFQFLLSREITRLNELCKTWSEIKTKPTTTEDGQYEINQTIGQTNLLIGKKFERFRGLVADCETGKGEMLVTCKDLQGFWDVMYIEVKNCDSRFEKLEKLRSRDWKEEELPVVKHITKKKSNVKRNVAFTKSSSFKAFVAKKRQKMTQEMRSNGDMKEVDVTSNQILSNKYEKNESFNVKYKTRKFMSSTPNKKDYTPIKHNKRLSLVQEVHLSETSKKINTPLTIIKVSQMCKTPEVNLDNTISYVNFDQTPGRSILQPSENATIAESRIKFRNKVNFDDHIILNEIPIGGETQTKVDLAESLSKIESFDNFDKVIIKAERKLAFDSNKKQKINEHDENTRVLRNRTVIVLDTPTVRRKSLKEVSTSIQELEHKENKTPSERRRRKSSFKGSINDKEKMDLYSWNDNMSLEESNVRRRSTRSVKFLEKECSGWELPMTPHVGRSRAQSSDRKRSIVTENLISWETPEKRNYFLCFFFLYLYERKFIAMRKKYKYYQQLI